MAHVLRKGKISFERLDLIGFFLDYLSFMPCGACAFHRLVFGRPVLGDWSVTHAGFLVFVVGAFKVCSLVWCIILL